MMKIGELARLVGVSTDTIRYYEKQGIMNTRSRDLSGYRLYNDTDLQRLRFIRYAKSTGFTLEAIKELLSIRVDPLQHTCQDSKSIVDERIAEVELKLKELTQMHESLLRLSAACCGSAHSSVSCSILEALEYGAGKAS